MVYCVLNDNAFKLFLKGHSFIVREWLFLLLVIVVIAICVNDSWCIQKNRYIILCYLM